MPIVLAAAAGYAAADSFLISTFGISNAEEEMSFPFSSGGPPVSKTYLKNGNQSEIFYRNNDRVSKDRSVYTHPVVISINFYRIRIDYLLSKFSRLSLFHMLTSPSTE